MTTTTARLTPADCPALHARAHEAGLQAANAARPTPMHVTERVNPWDDSSPVKRDYGIVADGVCGFAWVNTPGNKTYGRWARKSGTGRVDSYNGGVSIWVRGFGQSYERKMAYAAAYAGVLTEAGVTAYADGRLD